VRAYRIAVTALAVVFVAIGVALLAVTTAEGGGALGYLLGALFVGLGAGRLTLLLRGGR
jgi:TRAP-type mannitol/chloroaromatic compound transport system permease large subunit